MDAAVARTLAELNARFYAEHGEDFADARPRLPVGVKRVVTRIPPGAAVLEAGCGDGKVGRWLAAHTPGATYLGLDASATLLERARRFTDPAAPVTFALVDLLAEDWRQALNGRRFDWALAFALLHHLPGQAARARLVCALAEQLNPGGALAFSSWQFTRSERLRRRTVPWAALALSDTQVEPNDFLLAWERKGRRGLRYVHVLAEEEARALAAGAGLRVAEAFGADGVTGDLTDYVVLQKPG